MEKEIYIVETIRDYAAEQTTTDIDEFYKKDAAIAFINKCVDEEKEKDNDPECEHSYYDDKFRRAFYDRYGDWIHWKLYTITLKF